MFAVLRSGGKQYTVREGDSVLLSKIPGKKNDEVCLGEVLLVETDGKALFGAPLVEGAAVHGKITRQGKSRKILVFKMKRRKNYRRLRGHRQDFTEVLIKRIAAPSTTEGKPDGS